MGSRWACVCAGGALACVLTLQSAAQALAAHLVGSAGAAVCTGTVTETFAPPLSTTMPSTVFGTVDMTSSGSLACTGTAPASMQLVNFVAAVLTGATCGGPLAMEGMGNVSTPSASANGAAWAAVGTVDAQAWAILDPKLGLEVAGEASLQSAGGATDCLSGSVATVTLTAVLVILA